MTTEVTLEPGDEPGMYSGVQVLPEPGVWELRITGEPDGQFTSEWIDVFATPAQDADDEHDHDHGAGFDGGLSFPVVLLIGSVVVAIAGTVVTVREARQVRWFDESE